MPPPVYTDWQLSGVLYANTDDSPAFSTSYAFQPLMNPLEWRRCLRQDENQIDSSTTRVLRMSMNLRYTLYESNWAQITMFVVTLRKDSADRDLSTLAIGNDYINSFGQDMNVRVSPDLFKVHATRNVSITKNFWLGNRFVNPDTGVAAGFNPATTFKKGQVNVKLGTRIRNPNRTAPWKDMEIDQFSPNERYYLLCFFTQQAPDGTGQAAGARVDYDALFTCYNAS